MLRYDAAWLMQQYADEPPAAPGVPYALLGSGPYHVQYDHSPYRLAPAVEIHPQLPYDEIVTRLARWENSTLGVQACSYSDGVKSNYAMDAPGELREPLRAQYGNRLPPLDDGRLSNGIGTAIVVFGPDGRPYLPRRAPRQSVFPGGYHCTASGEAVWRDGELDFDILFTGNICRELEEEVGITRADLEWIRPVALCREFLRGGKPQFFFAARTRLDDHDLQHKRQRAIEQQLQHGRQEVMDDAMREFDPSLCTIECVANVVLAHKFGELL